MKRKQKPIWLIMALILCLSLQSLLIHAEGISQETNLGTTVETTQNSDSSDIRAVLDAPSGIKAEVRDGTSVRISWDEVSGATAYIVYRWNEMESTWERLDAIWGFSYVDSNVEFGKKYLYRVQSMSYADGQWGAGGYSEEAEILVALGVPTDVNATFESSAVKLSWKTDGSASVFGIMRAEQEDGTYQWLTAVNGASTYVDSTAAFDKTYYYKVYAAAYTGGVWYNGDTSTAVRIYVPDPYALTMPESLNVENEKDSLLISWGPASNATAYIVYRFNDKDNGWERLDAVWATEYTDKQVDFNKEYLYRVQSVRYVNGQWEGGPYSEPVGKKLIPTAPVNVNVTSGYGNQALKVSWDIVGKANTFGIMRAENMDGPYEWRGVVTGSNSFVEEGLEVGKTYFYQVYSTSYLNGQWCNGMTSVAAEGHIQAAPSEVKVQAETFTSTRIIWTPAYGAYGYMVWRISDDGNNWIALGSTGQNEYIDTNLDINRTYQYKIQSLNYVDGRWGYAAYSSIAEGKPGIGVPQQVSAVQDSKEYYSIYLTWRPVGGVNTYGIMRSEHGKDMYEWIGSSNVNGFEDGSGNAGAQYDYKVYAAEYKDGVWYNGECSAPITITVREWGGPPVISNVNISYLSGQGYYVSCNIAASNPISQVIFPTWTTNGGQDDIVWRTGTVNGATAGCWIYSSEHNYEVGQYETCIYAEDSTGKLTGTWCSANVPVYSHGSGTGWYDTNGSQGERFYLLNGTAVTGWKYIGGLKYYFYPNGVLCQDVDNLIGVQSKYMIKVNKQMNCVTIYASDGANGYVIPVKSMLCSTGDDTPLGTFYTPQKYRWKLMYNNTWAQFATRLTAGEGFLFHSITYETTNNRTLLTDGYNGLGVTRSAGCIRLLCKNAYWIYSRCSLGTKVIVYNSSNPGPFYRPILVPIPSNQRYDPTDPFL
ncbi:GBS Bsp-like repeat-containing protein [Lacrimispora sp. NSJ-141]|uniref:GBS Bsp-like repeat-containing protein n=1 Tax=Lientehia hominis TaxID=2897778 RepID=A0AAP2RHA1_9FIRM|nr:L,D-transpeptidase family protein [Lientehia hominis]MCD2492137.1 GBS Bsp-like repeat-containing protein [Lientehia hominis]